MAHLYKKFTLVILAFLASTAHAYVEQLQVFDAYYHYTKKCQSQGKTAYFQGNHGYTVANLQELRYTRNYMLTVASMSGYSQSALEEQLTQTRPALTRQLVSTGQLICP